MQRGLVTSSTIAKDSLSQWDIHSVIHSFAFNASSHILTWRISSLRTH